MKQLLSGGANVNEEYDWSEHNPSEGRTVIASLASLACWFQRAPKERGEEGEAGETPLYRAAGLDDPQIAQVLGPAVCLVDRSSVAVAGAACCSGHCKSVCVCVLRKGLAGNCKKKNTFSSQADVNWSGSDFSFTALHQARACHVSDPWKFCCARTEP